jgi:hypothetical protein
MATAPTPNVPFFKNERRAAPAYYPLRISPFVSSFHKN